MSLIGTLRAGYFLRAWSLLLECVVEASRDKEVRAVLAEFCRLTHFRQSEVELALDTIVPTKRNRWWCTLTGATLPKPVLSSLPVLSRPPVVNDLLPFCPHWPKDHMYQLALDQYETGKFEEFGGIEPNLVKSDGVVRTALHGWANQLTPCPCKCRQYPMSEDRLRNKGLFGALVKLSGEYQTTLGKLPKTRHMHPWEMCLIHGGVPEYDWNPLRYSIAALGQMASPIQSCWVAAHILVSCHEAQDIMPIPPAQHLWNHFCRVFQGVSTTQPDLLSAHAFQCYIGEIHGTLHAMCVQQRGPQCASKPEASAEHPDDDTIQTGPNKRHSGVEDGDPVPRTLDETVILAHRTKVPKLDHVHCSTAHPFATKHPQVLSHVHPASQLSVTAPTATAQHVPDGNDKSEANSQRMGRKDPFREQEKIKQPAYQTQGLGQNTQQPAVEARELPPPMSLHAKPPGPQVPSGPAPVPMTPQVSQPLPCEMPSKGTHATASSVEADPFTPCQHRCSEQDRISPFGQFIAPGPSCPVYLHLEQKNISNSQRMGRKDPQSQDDWNKQPANRPQVPGQNTQQPAVETRGLPPPMCLHAMPDGTRVSSGPALAPLALSATNATTRPEHVKGQGNHLTEDWEPCAKGAFRHAMSVNDRMPIAPRPNRPVGHSEMRMENHLNGHQLTNQGHTFSSLPTSDHARGKATLRTDAKIDDRDDYRPQAHAEIGQGVQASSPKGISPAMDGQAPHDERDVPPRPMPLAMPAKPLRGPGPAHASVVEDGKPLTNDDGVGSSPGPTPDGDSLTAVHPALRPDPTGGIHAFASNHAAQQALPSNPIERPNPTNLDRSEHAPQRTESTENPEGDGLTQEMLTTATAFEATLPDNSCVQTEAPSSADSHVIQVFRPEDLQPMNIRVQATTTVGSITVAEAKLGSMTQPICINTSVGTRLPLAAVTQPYDQIFLKELAEYDHHHTPDVGYVPPDLFSQCPVERITLLHRQEAFVGQDEMEFYLDMLAATGQTIKSPPVILPEVYEDEELVLAMQNWLAKVMLIAEAPCTLVSAIFAHYHWFPVGIKFGHGKIDLFTTPGGHDWVKIVASEPPQVYTVHTRPIAHSFANDCGFQAIGWLTSFVFDPTHDQQLPQPASIANAMTWRNLFEQHLHATGDGQARVKPSTIAFGGVSNGDVIHTLCTLIQQHGVPEEAVKERANIIMEKIGRMQVTRALRGQQPWRELKQLANQCAPKLQLIMPSELQEVIAARVQSQQTFGSKQNKKKTAVPKRPLQIDASDIGIPEGIFQDAAGQGLQQLSIAQIGPEARGIVVANAQQAIPYLKFAKPISQFGLAMLVVDHRDPTLHGIGEEIRCPARCERTSEPMLMSAKLVQLGSVLVSRITPENSLRVDEVKTTVLRLVVHKDEVEKRWEHILAKPVKHLVQSVPILGLRPDGTSPILDVWDRQWLNEKMERAKPDLASVFSATFRLETSDIQGALKDPGCEGCYAEPRSPDGRAPCPEYRVIWLNKQTKQSVLLASQATAKWTCVVRAGHRFGLRCLRADAQQVHEQHKPHTPFLDSDQVLTYHVGPFPHGANRAALNKLFQSWSWQARPCQPKTRTPDGKGVVWECQAVQKPQYEVYQLEHADVLITEVPRKPARPAPSQANIQASAKTIAALQSSDSQTAGDVDPWSVDDPWAKYETPVKTAKRNPVSEHGAQNIDAIAAKVQQILSPAWKQASSCKSDGDHDMHQAEARLMEVEDRLNKLEQTAQTTQAQTKELAVQINQVQHNVEAQSRAFHAHLDDKLDKQLHQIEQLLSKRSRHE
eukprot:s375_g4.t1